MTTETQQPADRFLSLPDPVKTLRDIATTADGAVAMLNDVAVKGPERKVFVQASLERIQALQRKAHGEMCDYLRGIGEAIDASKERYAERHRRIIAFTGSEDPEVWAASIEALADSFQELAEQFAGADDTDGKNRQSG